MQQIADWLEKLGMSEYAQRFAENGIDVSVLPHLTDQDLKDIGVLLGHRRKMLAAIAELAGSAPTTLEPVAATGPKTQDTAERRYLTVMFCDLVDSTGIAARLDAEEWRDLVGAYLDAAFGGGDGDGRPCRQEAGRRADGAVRLSGGAGERCGARGAGGARDPACARRAEPQECRLGQARACCPHRPRNWSGGGRCGGRDFRRRAQHRGAGAGARRAGCGRGHGAGAAPGRRPVRRRGARQPRNSRACRSR